MTFLRYITLIGVLMISGCYSSSDNADRTSSELNREMETIRSEVQQEFNLYQSENENRLMGFDQTMDEIQQNIDNESDVEHRARLDAELKQYEATHRDLKHEIDTYEVSDKDNWNRFKDSFTSRMDNLGSSLNEFFSSVGAGSPSGQP